MSDLLLPHASTFPFPLFNSLSHFYSKRKKILSLVVIPDFFYLTPLSPSHLLNSLTSLSPKHETNKFHLSRTRNILRFQNEINISKFKLASINYSQNMNKKYLKKMRMNCFLIHFNQQVWLKDYSASITSIVHFDSIQ